MIDSTKSTPQLDALAADSHALAVAALLSGRYSQRSSVMDTREIRRTTRHTDAVIRLQDAWFSEVKGEGRAGVTR